ncbi:hypothetical protein D9613_009763 [Agrocybe pediades]|uniref:F-box domain-containing protein n=1 Tax=Agrocybe pediades TaxID=84607 RepID=A0A8H4VPU0_9AGAR|nr:hypothetical protein D9613_009763 [Agrocybe pediades]
MLCSPDCTQHKYCIDPVTPLDYLKSGGGCPFAPSTCEPCRAFPELEEEIRKTAERLEGLLSRHRALRTEVNHCHSPIIRDLPVEILTGIFDAYLPDDYKVISLSPYRRPTLSQTAIPLRLGAVCRSWRQAAWLTPSLWTHVYVSLNKPYTPYLLNQYRILENWIQRSGSLPVDVNVFENDLHVNDIDRERVKKCLQLVVQCADRWRDVRLHVRRKWHQCLFSFLSQADGMALCPLQLRKFEFTSHGEDFQFPPDFTIKPQQLDIAERWPGRLNDLTGLICLRVSNWSWQECLEVLRQAPCLVSCHFIYVKRSFVADTLAISESHVLHNSIQQISFDTLPPSGLQLLTAPCLREFRLSGEYFKEADIPALSAFLTRSRFSLARLDLPTREFTPTFFISLLHELSALEHLTLNVENDEEMVIDPFLQRLIATTEDTNCFLPRLEYLAFNGNNLYFP